MNSDAYYTIGKTHKVCQDYALSGRSKSGKAFAIVSDGCSSSPHTDVGARLLVWTTKEILEEDIAPDIKVIIRHAAAAAAILNLPQSCLDATLIIARESAPGVEVSMWGDGIIFGKNNSGYFAEWIEYESGAPFYPSYLLSSSRLDSYRNKYDGKKKIGHSWLKKYMDGDMDETLSVERKIGRWFNITHDFIVIGTDGAMAFGEHKTTETSKTIEPVEPQKVVEKLASIKGFNGEFIARRCKRFFTKQCAGLNWEPQDDVAIGGIYLGGPK